MGTKFLPYSHNADRTGSVLSELRLATLLEQALYLPPLLTLRRQGPSPRGELGKRRCRLVMVLVRWGRLSIGAHSEGISPREERNGGSGEFCW